MSVFNSQFKRRRFLTALGGGMLLLRSGVSAAQDPSALQRTERARQWFTDTVLEDQDRKRHLFYSGLLEPRAVLINAVFVGCSSACPLLTQQLARVRDGLGERFGRDIWFLSITVDPLNDGPDELKKFASRQGADGPGWRFLTGSPADIQAVTRAAGPVGKGPGCPSDRADCRSRPQGPLGQAATRWFATGIGTTTRSFC